MFFGGFLNSSSMYYTHFLFICKTFTDLHPPQTLSVHQPHNPADTNFAVLLHSSIQNREHVCFPMVLLTSAWSPGFLKIPHLVMTLGYSSMVYFGNGAEDQPCRQDSNIEIWCYGRRRKVILKSNRLH